MHYAREILVEPRTEGERYENLPDAYGAELLVARVHKKDGSVVPPEEQDANGPMVRWPKLERGDVVEVAVRSWTPGPVGRRGDPPFHFVDYVGGTDTRPVLYNEVILDAPASAPLSFDVIGGKADRRTQTTKGDRRITHLIWDTPPTIPDEPWAPPLSELMPVVVGSAYASWDEFLDWYRGAVEGFTEPDEQVKRMAEQLTEGKQGREQKVEALFDFVADDIRYVNFVSGEWWLPNRPQQLLARRQGDCDDKAMLLISLLKAVGIDAQEVLIQTRMTRQRAVMKSANVAIPMFDHGIVFLPDGKGGGRYLDATSPQSRLGVTPAMDSGAMALVVQPNARIVETPAPAAADHGISASWVMDLQADGAGHVRADERHVGDAGFMLRNQLREQDARAQWIEQSLAGDWFPSLQIDPKVEFDPELPGGAARVRYQLDSRAMARREGSDLVVALAPPIPLTAGLASLTSRKLAVELPPHLAPSHRNMTLTIRAPASHVFSDLPPDGLADGGPFGRAELKLKLSADKRSVIAERTVGFVQYRIEAADYPSWRSWLQSIDRLMQRSVRLVKK
jgi:transglutaminase-like putative cysteine protease